MSRIRAISLHIGVHKTATTYIQSRLINSRELLREHNIGCMPLNEVRSLISNRLNDSDFSAEDVLGALNPYSEFERLVISDENIIGGTNEPKGNRIYPWAKKRLAKILDALPEEIEVEVFLTLRDYVSYFISRYTEYLRHFPFQDFCFYYREIDMATVSWFNLINDIKSAGKITLRLTPFESLFDDEQGYFNSLLGRMGVPLEPGDDNPWTRRSKLTQQGYEVVQFFAKNYSADATKKIVNLVDYINQTTPISPFLPFSNEQQEILNSRFRSEMAALQGSCGV